MGNLSERVRDAGKEGVLTGPRLRSVVIERVSDGGKEDELTIARPVARGPRSRLERSAMQGERMANVVGLD